MMLPASTESLGALEALELWRVDTQLRRPLRAAHGRHELLGRVYLRVLTEQGEGWGELSALDDPIGLDPSRGQVERELERRWLPLAFEAAAARGGACVESHSVGMLGGSSPLDQAAAAVLEMAVLDAELRHAELSLPGFLGVDVSGVPFGGLVGIPPGRSADEAILEASSLLRDGASRLRVKVDPGFCIDPLEALRSAFPVLPIQADANGSLGERPELLAELDELELACIEQPSASRDLSTLARLAASLRTPVCLDETISSRRVARDALRYGACRVLCVKPGRVGGLRATIAILAEAASQGASCFIGGMFETGLGRAYLASIAALPEVDLVSDVVSPGRYLLDDPCGLPEPVGSLQPLHLEPGVGPWPDRSALELVASLQH